MNVPGIGELNRRVKIYHTVSLPDERLGFTKSSLKEDVLWGITHRVIVRSIPGRTRPQDFKGVTEIFIDGTTYRLRRVADLGGLDRFTVLDVEEKGDACSMPRRSWLQGN